SVIIIIFHAFYAFLFPLLIVYNIFLSSARKPWMTNTVLILVSSAFFIYGSWHFLVNMHKPVTVYHYILLVISMIILLRVAKNFRSTRLFERTPTKFWLPLIYGFCFVLILFTISDMIARSRINPI